MKWLSVSCAVLNSDTVVHFHELCGLQIPKVKQNNVFLSLSWLAFGCFETLVTIIFYGNNEINGELIIEQIKIQVWWWLKVKVNGFKYDFNHWWSNPFQCRGFLDLCHGWFDVVFRNGLGALVISPFDFV